MGFIGKMIKFKIAKEVGKRVWDYMKSDKSENNKRSDTSQSS